MNPPNHSFRVVRRGVAGEKVLVRTDDEVWLVRYPRLEGQDGTVRPAHWCGFKACAPKRKGAEFYSRDNRLITKTPLRNIHAAVAAGMTA